MSVSASNPATGGGPANGAKRSDIHVRNIGLRTAGRWGMQTV